MLKTKYYYSLDLFRGLCGYGVAICHLNAFVFENLYAEYISYLFVEFFFILSGFVLYPQLLKVLNNKKNLLIFYQRRWLRTIPLYVVVTISVAALTSNLFSNDFYKYLFFIQKTIPNFLENDFFPVAWSLSIEEIFYLFFPLILINLKKSNFLNYTFLIIIFFILLKVFTVGKVDANFLRTGSFLRLDAILLGFILGHFKEKLISKKIEILLISFLFILIYLLSFEYFMNNNNSSNKQLILVVLLQFISSSILFSFIYLEKFINNSKIKFFCLLISKQTYSIYLTHIIFIYLLKKVEFSIAISTFIYIISLFVCSSIIYKYFEKPFLNIRPKIK